MRYGFGFSGSIIQIDPVPAPGSDAAAMVLLSGDHRAIADWRHQQRLARTAARRPDLRTVLSELTSGQDLAGMFAPLVAFVPTRFLPAPGEASA